MDVGAVELGVRRHGDHPAKLGRRRATPGAKGNGDLPVGRFAGAAFQAPERTDNRLRGRRGDDEVTKRRNDEGQTAGGPEADRGLAGGWRALPAGGNKRKRRNGKTRKGARKGLTGECRVERLKSCKVERLK